jgi:hypothetical protein
MMITPDEAIDAAGRQVTDVLVFDPWVTDGNTPTLPLSPGDSRPRRP